MTYVRYLFRLQRGDMFLDSLGFQLQAFQILLEPGNLFVFSQKATFEVAAIIAVAAAAVMAAVAFTTVMFLHLATHSLTSFHIRI